MMQKKAVTGWKYPLFPAVRLREILFVELLENIHEAIEGCFVGRLKYKKLSEPQITIKKMVTMIKNFNII